MDKKLDLSKDVMLNTGVQSAEFETQTSRWHVKLSTGEVYDARFFVLCTGFAAKRYEPNFKGREKFKGIIHHTGMYSTVIVHNVGLFYIILC